MEWMQAASVKSPELRVSTGAETDEPLKAYLPDLVKRHPMTDSRETTFILRHLQLVYK